MITRKVKFDLSKYDDSWKGSFMLLKVSSFRETIELQKEIGKTERDAYKLEKEIKKAEKADEDLLELMERKDEAAAKQLQTLIEIVKKRFISGSVVDEGKLRDMSAKDIEEFDIGILGEVIEAITGQVGKKA